MKWESATNKFRQAAAMTEGLPPGKVPDFSLRGPVEHLDIVQAVPIATSHDKTTLLYNATGSQVVAAFWTVHAGLALTSVTHGGNGLWLCWLVFTLLCLMRQFTNLTSVSTSKVRVRTGWLGYRETDIGLTELNALWIQQGALGRLLNLGRLGFRLQNGDILWSPVLSHPLRAKRAVMLAIQMHNGRLQAL